MATIHGIIHEGMNIGKTFAEFVYRVLSDVQKERLVHDNRKIIVGH